MAPRVPAKVKCPRCGETFAAKKGHACGPKLFRCRKCGVGYNNPLTHVCRRSFKKG